ncbi:hypothetical protein BDN70DRAFT_932870 [Pholiota conissans]|uniref:Uncharacterized protein n=1 Tax=Pholiota conissans TaxID=109636 RepID=A0A9P5Z0E1_9AGAR|nr:hypothetical protein BDN70DRAFT_932870 [Pholiota conissans]
MARTKTGARKATGESPFNLTECTVSFAPRSYLKHLEENAQLLDVTAQTPDFTVIGKLKCIIIARGKMELMDEAGGELKEFSRAIFDSQGVVNPWLIDGSYRSGSRFWGEELNNKKMVYILSLNVKEPYRNQGVGSCLLRELFESPTMSKLTAFRSAPIYYCSPGTFGDRGREQGTRFVLKNRFRRIGRTRYFAYSHKCHDVPMEVDAEELKNEFKQKTAMSPEQWKLKYPLHSVISTNMTSEISAILSVVHALNATTIHTSDDHGFTPLHIAAAHANVRAVRVLLELGGEIDLRNLSNSEYMTPLEKVQDKMRRDRELTETMRLNWEGHSRDALTCEYLMKKMLHIPLENSEEEYFAKRRLGCSCGSCLDHWLSPRMIESLQIAAFRVGFSMEHCLEDVVPGKKFVQPHGQFHEAVKYLPRKLPVGMCKSFFSGYRAVFMTICELLADSPSVNFGNIDFCF